MKFYLCHECKEAFESTSAFNGHWSLKHKDLQRPSWEKIEADQLPEGYTLRGKREADSPPPQHGGTDDQQLQQQLQQLQQQLQQLQQLAGQGEGEDDDPYRKAEKPVDILRRILSSHPKISDKVANEVISWAEYEALTPMNVAHLLSNMDVPKGTVNIVSQKYALALQKAAKEGDAEVQMLLSSWGDAGKPPPPGWTGGGFSFPPPFVPAYQGYGYPGYPGHGFPYHEERPAKKVEVKEGSSDEMKALKSQLEELQQQLRKQEEEAREERHRREIQELKDSHSREMEKVEERYKEEIARIEREREKELNEVKEMIGALQSKLGSREETRDEKLKAEIESLKNELKDEKYGNLLKKVSDLEKREPANPTELEVIRDTAKEGINALKNAGSDLKTVFMARGIQEQFPPGRRSPEERQKLGEQIVENLEKDREATRQMDQFFTKYRGE